MRKIFGLVILFSILLVVGNTSAEEPFYASVCRNDEEFKLHLWVETYPETPVEGIWVGPEAQRVGYALTWAYDDHWVWDEVVVEPGSPVDVQFSLPEGMTPNTLTVWWLDIGSYSLEFALDDTTPQCTDEGTVLQCDPSSNENAVMVTFGTETELLWTYDESAHTDTFVQAGQTAWAVGNEGSFTQISWSCSSLWVDSGSIAW